METKNKNSTRHSLKRKAESEDSTSQESPTSNYTKRNKPVNEMDRYRPTESTPRRKERFKTHLRLFQEATKENNRKATELRNSPVDNNSPKPTPKLMPCGPKVERVTPSIQTIQKDQGNPKY